MKEHLQELKTYKTHHASLKVHEFLLTLSCETTWKLELKCMISRVRQRIFLMC